MWQRSVPLGEVRKFRFQILFDIAGSETDEIKYLRIYQLLI